MQDDKTKVEHLSRSLADHLQQLIDAGENAGHVADAAIAAGASLRLQTSGPLILSQLLTGLAKRAAIQAVVDWGMKERARAHPPSTN